MPTFLDPVNSLLMTSPCVCVTVTFSSHQLKTDDGFFLVVTFPGVDLFRRHILAGVSAASVREMQL